MTVPTSTFNIVYMLFYNYLEIHFKRYGNRIYILPLQRKLQQLKKQLFQVALIHQKFWNQAYSNLINIRLAVFHHISLFKSAFTNKLICNFFLIINCMKNLYLLFSCNIHTFKWKVFRDLFINLWINSNNDIASYISLLYRLSLNRAIYALPNNLI